MYQVLTQEKAPRPRLALVASVALLVVSVFLALGVMAGRRKVPDTELGERLRLGGWPITVRCPAGWTATGGMGATSGFVFLEGPRRGGGRQLRLQRFGPLPFRPPSYLAKPGTIGQILGLPDHLLEGLYRDLGPVPFGQMPGALVLVGPFAIHLGAAPDGSVYWVMMDSPNPATPADIQVLRDVTASVELLDPQIVEDPSALWETSAFRFDAPSGARFVGGGTEGAESVICFGDPAEKGAWHIEMRPTFLAPGREPASLARDYLARAAGGVEPEEIEQSGDGPYAYAHGRREEAQEGGLVQTVAVRALNGGLAVMLLGTADAAGRAKLEQAEDTILRTLRGNGETVDLSPALEQGRWLAARVSRDVAEQWSEQDREWWYLILHDGTPVGFNRVARQAATRSGEEGFYVDAAYYLKPSAQALYQGRSVGFLPRDGKAVTMTARGRRRTEGESSTWTMTERLEQGETALRHEWSNDGGAKISRTAPIDANFLMDPLPEWAFYVAASEADAEETFLVSTSGQPLVHDVYWTRVTSLRPGAGAGADTRRGGLGVLVSHDFDPQPARWYFDPRGDPTEIQFGGGRSVIAASKRQVYARFRDAERVLAEMQAWWNR